MSPIAYQITSLTIVYSTVYSDTYQRKHKSSASLAFVRGIHRWPVNSPHKGPVTRKIFPFDDVIMKSIKHHVWYITRPCPDFSGGLAKPPLKVQHWWVVTSHACLAIVTLKFDGWHWKTIWHLFYVLRSIPKPTVNCNWSYRPKMLKLAILLACVTLIFFTLVTLKNNRAHLLCPSKLWVSFHSHLRMDTRVIRNWGQLAISGPWDFEIRLMTFRNNGAPLLCHSKFVYHIIAIFEFKLRKHWIFFT